MRVVTLSQNEFDDACLRLVVGIANDCSPIAIVGIKRGGAIVAEKVFLSLSENVSGLKLFDVTALRTTTIIKRKVSTGSLFKLLPTFVLNVLRVFEYYLVKAKMRFADNAERHVHISNALSQYLAGLPEGCVYIIDDAIDSGATIKSILNELHSINSSLKYKVAVLVVTQRTPLVLPDIYLYKNVLLRFPWSSDYKR